jgi:hypothetical protein
MTTAAKYSVGLFSQGREVSYGGYERVHLDRLMGRGVLVWAMCGTGGVLVDQVTCFNEAGHATGSVVFDVRLMITVGIFPHMKLNGALAAHLMGKKYRKGIYA